MKKFALKTIAIFLLYLPINAVFAPAHSYGVYTKGGLLGVGLGASLGITDYFSVHTDYTTAGSYNRDLTVNKLNYHVRLKTEQWGVYGNVFPFANGWRLSAGLHVRNLRAQAHAQPVEEGSIGIGRFKVLYGPEDKVSGEIEYPRVAPYLGIGWGHHPTQKPGFGMVFDMGVSFGKPTVDLRMSDSLRKKLHIASVTTGGDPDHEFDRERRDLEEKTGRVAVFPHLYLGLSYWF